GRGLQVAVEGRCLRGDRSEVGHACILAAEGNWRRKVKGRAQSRGMSSETPRPDPDTRFPEQVSVACHDLRTPLATVYGFARTRGRLGGLDDRQRRSVGMVVAGAQEPTRLIDDLATLTRLERRIQPIETGRVNLTELIDTVATEAAERHAPGRTIYAPNHGEGFATTDHRLAASALSGLIDRALPLDPPADPLRVGA